MIEIKKTENGVVGFGTIDGDDIIKAFLEALGYDDDEAEDENEVEDTLEETCDCEEAEPIETSEAVENEHLVSVGYNGFDDVVVINYDTPEHPWAVAAALLDAAAEMWPKKIDKDKELAQALHELAAMGRDIGDAYVEDDQ